MAPRLADASHEPVRHQWPPVTQPCWPANHWQRAAAILVSYLDWCVVTADIDHSWLPTRGLRWPSRGSRTATVSRRLPGDEVGRWRPGPLVYAKRARGHGLPRTTTSEGLSWRGDPPRGAPCGALTPIRSRRLPFACTVYTNHCRRPDLWGGAHRPCFPLNVTARRVPITVDWRHNTRWVTTDPHPTRTFLWRAAQLHANVERGGATVHPRKGVRKKTAVDHSARPPRPRLRD